LPLKGIAREEIIQPYPAKGRRRSESKEPLRVFLVEDNVDTVELLTTACEEIDNVVVVGWSASADDAIDRIAVSEPDVVLIDNQLRCGSGIDVIRAIRSMDPVPRPLLLAMSNALNRAVREANLDADADEYFDKTIDHVKLLTRIAALAR
jgi:CheY-like chemotaxis protein